MSELPCQEHEAKIAVLEVKVGHLEGSAANTRVWLQSIDGKVNEINAHLARQNGAIPHMVDDLGKLSESFESLHNKVSNLQIANTRTETKTMVLWSVLATICGTIIAIIVKVLFGS